MKYLFVLIFIIVYIIFDKRIGYTDTSALWTHFTYMFQHANVIHLIINSLAFIGMFRVLEKVINKYILAISIILISSVVSYTSMYELPTVGISGGVYVMIGIYLAVINIKKIQIWQKAYRHTLFVFIFSVILCLAISFFKTNSNFWLHLYSLIMGYVFWMIVKLYKIINKQYR